MNNEAELTLELEQHWTQDYDCYRYKSPTYGWLQISFDKDISKWVIHEAGCRRPMSHKTATEALRTLKALCPEYRPEARGQ